MPYPKAGVHKFTLEEFALEASDLWVEMREPDNLPANTLSSFYRAQLILARAKRGDIPEREEEYALKATEGVATAAILDWNLPYPDDHPNRGLIIPLRDAEKEPDPFGALPQNVYIFVMAQVMGRLQTPSKSS